MIIEEHGTQSRDQIFTFKVLIEFGEIRVYVWEGTMERVTKGSTLAVLKVRVTGYDGDLGPTGITAIVQHEMESVGRSVKGQLTVHDQNMLHWHPHPDDISIVGPTKLQVTFHLNDRDLVTAVKWFEVTERLYSAD
jgi:hypothetical protein